VALAPEGDGPGGRDVVVVVGSLDDPAEPVVDVELEDPAEVLAAVELEDSVEVEVVVDSGDPDVHEVDDSGVDEPADPEVARGAPVAHAAAAKERATRTPNSDVARHARRLLVDCRSAVSSVRSEFMALPLVPGRGRGHRSGSHFYETQGDTKVTAVTWLSRWTCHPWEVARRDRRLPSGWNGCDARAGERRR